MSIVDIVIIIMISGGIKFSCLVGEPVGASLFNDSYDHLPRPPRTRSARRAKTPL